MPAEALTELGKEHGKLSQSLQTLRLCDCKLTGIDSILPLLEKATKLQNLYLEKNEIEMPS